MKKSLPLGTVVLILVLALASIGIGYGLWAETLTIRGTVYTGDVDLELTGPVEIDDGNDFNDGKLGNGVWDMDEAEGKDVGLCYARLLDQYTMEVVVENAYPYYNCFIRYDVHNAGSIPIHLFGPDYFYDVDDDGIVEDSEFFGTGGPGVYFTIDTDEIHINTFPDCDFVDGQQVHPSEWGYCDLHISLYQAAAEKDVHRFQVRWWGRQWNETWENPPWRP
jgi:hypothetical protein